MSKDSLITEFKGYRRKRDDTNQEPGVLVFGSQNVLTTDGDRVGSRKGYTLDGQANDSQFPIRSAYDWTTHRGVDIHLRRSDDELEVRFVDANNQVTWNRLKDGLSTTAITQFAEWWDDTEKQDILLFVDEDSNIYDWSGGMATFASATANSITKQGAETWAESGFLTTGTRQVIINGVAYTYTGGESTTTLTDVTPDPTTAGHAVGSLILQAVRTNSNKPGSNLKNNLIATMYNQVYVGQTTSRVVYVSKATDFKDFGFSSPRLPGEGALLTLDQSPTGFAPQEKAMYLSTKDFWYQTVFQPSADLLKESLTIERLKTAGQKGAKSQGFIANDGNRVIFVTNEPTFDQLGRIENIDTPQSKPLSDPIKTDFDLDKFNIDGHVKFWKNNYYIAIPSSGVVRIYNLEKRYWEPPQTIPIRRFSIIDGELYGHSAQTPETYKLFSGGSDNGNAIHARAVFAYENYGNRRKKKGFDEFFTEGYITSHTKLDLVLRYDYQGSTTTKEITIKGDDDDLLFTSPSDESLGNLSLGEGSLGTGAEEDEDVLPPKFRHIFETEKVDFYELQYEYTTNDKDQQWEILAVGPNAEFSQADNNDIKRSN